MCVSHGNSNSPWFDIDTCMYIEVTPPLAYFDNLADDSVQKSMQTSFVGCLACETDYVPWIYHDDDFGVNYQ